MNIGLLVAIHNRTHAVDDGQQSARVKAGDIIAVEPWDTANPDLMQGGVPVPPAHPDMAWVVVTDVPQEILRRARDVLCAPGESETDGGQPLGKRRWRIPPASLPTSIRNTVLSQRWVNFTWTQVKNYLIRVRTGGAIADGDIA
jgi:hypothetical protein